MRNLDVVETANVAGGVGTDTVPNETLITLVALLAVITCTNLSLIYLVR